MRITVQQLKRLIAEATKDRWTGLGTDTAVLHRHEPKKRTSAAQRSAALRAKQSRLRDAERLWDAADPDDRAKFVRNELDGYERDAQLRMADATWVELEDMVGDEIEYVARRVDDWWGLER